MSGDWRGTLLTLLVTFCIVIIRFTEIFDRSIYISTCLDLSQVILSFPSQHKAMTYARKHSPTQITSTTLLSAFIFPFYQRIPPLHLFPLLSCKPNCCVSVEVPELNCSNHASICAGIQWHVIGQKILFY
jgi:hypothetical protein